VSKTKLWEAHRTPAIDACKRFNKAGGFKGTAIDPMWLILEATREWGPIGSEWGYDVISESVERLGDGWILHTCNIELWYLHDHCGKCSVPSTGNTWLVFTKTNGELKYDDEASKKSRTDAISKALSWLGFGADVHMGIFDGNKYADLFEEEKKEQGNKEEKRGNNEDKLPNNDEEEWTSPDEDDNALGVVKENYAAIKEKFGASAKWHQQILENFLGVETDSLDEVTGAIKKLNEDQMRDLIGYQKTKLGAKGE